MLLLENHRGQDQFERFPRALRLGFSRRFYLCCLSRAWLIRGGYSDLQFIALVVVKGTVKIGCLGVPGNGLLDGSVEIDAVVDGNPAQFKVIFGRLLQIGIGEAFGFRGNTGDGADGKSSSFKVGLVGSFDGINDAGHSSRKVTYWNAHVPALRALQHALADQQIIGLRINEAERAIGAGEGIQSWRLCKGQAPAATQEEGDTEPLQHRAITIVMMQAAYQSTGVRVTREKWCVAQGLTLQTRQVVQKRNNALAKNRSG